jgi:hypothetical protein
MPKTVSFVSLTLSALRLVRSSRSAWLFFIPFGGAVLLAGFVPHEFRLLLEGQSSRLADGSLGERWFLLSITLLAGATLLRIACRGPLVLILDRERRKPLAGNTPGETSVSPLRAIRITFLFEISYWIALGLLGLVLALPLSIAWKANPAILPTLARFALFFFLCLSLYLFLLKEFSFYYSLLGRSRFRSALELGERLLRRHTFLSLLFGLYATLLSFLFTFSIDSAMLMVAATPHPVLSEGLQSLLSISAFGIFALFEQALRLLFFVALAAPSRHARERARQLAPAESTSGTPV